MSWLKIEIPFKIKKPILAAGADIKNRICFAKDNLVFINAAIEDLEIPGNFDKFKKGIAAVPRCFKVLPKLIACDDHPEYFSRRYLLGIQDSRRSRLISVNHHHAHIASCMLENGLTNQKVIGVAFDGTGFGSDNTLWGAEFLLADYKGFKRAAHLRNIALLGSKAAILQPWRLAAAWLYLAFGNRFLDLNLLPGLKRQQWSVLETMFKHGFNAPLASSIGRLFDAAACLILGIQKVKFEAEAAIILEKFASRFKGIPTSYPFKINKNSSSFIIDPLATFKGIVKDLKHNHKKEEMAARFHMTVAQMINKVCRKIRENSNINTVALSGGVFQNRILLNLSSELLKRAGFRILTHKVLSCSDASISLGQMAIANFAK